MMIISNICHIIHRCSRSNLGDHRGLLGHSLRCVAAVLLTMYNNFFYSLKIGKIAKGTTDAFNKKLFFLASQQKIYTSMGKLMTMDLYWTCAHAMK